MSMDAFLSGPMEMAPAGQPFSQGRWVLTMALYWQALTQRPQVTHLSWSMWARWFTMEMASLGQAWTQRVARQPRQESPTVISVTGHSSQAMGSTSTTQGLALSPPMASFTRLLMMARSL